ncbi:hypothetical protein F5148DRAFT_1306547 [Russula earlei]|uniref:Uncharacterized protein n=1 Tax=Russula earlei TaxID=71964 RepID=A0ACC0TS18_9AGAM|nr:hypothetical protein F5148DRAFT_1306547 [Russula earlei]
MTNSTNNNSIIENDIAIDTIIATIQPEAIYRLPATSTNSDMELIVVIPDTAQTLFKHYEAILELVNIQHNNSFRYWLRYTTQLHQLLINKTPFYLDNCTIANRIYDNGSHKLPAFASEQKAATGNAITGFTITYGKALTFMEGARQLAQRENHAMAAFMLYQCIELSLHAIIQAFTGQDKAIHSIPALLEQVQTIYQRL